MSHPRPEFTYLGHATVLATLPGGETLLIDPWIDGNPSCPKTVGELGRVDALLLTHGHFDHIGDVVEVAKHYRPKTIVASFELGQWLESKGVENVSPMNLGGCQEVLGCSVHMVRADHSSGITDGDRILYGGPAAGYVVRLPEGYTFYHLGDTALFSDLQLFGEIHRPELAFVPIGDLFTMDPQQAARAAKLLGVREVVPIHWGTFPPLTGTPEQLEKQVADLGVNCRVVTLQPGESH